MKGNKFAVIGVGKYGSIIAKKLAEKGAEVYAFDIDQEKIENIKDSVAYAAALDSTDEKALLAQKVEDIDAAIIAIGENFEAVILTAVYLIEINVKRVIARASGEHQIKILEKVGITEILTPESEVASIVAERLVNPSIVSFLELPDNYEIAEIKTPKALIAKRIDEVGLREKYLLNFVTLKREFEVTKNGKVNKEQHILGMPNSETFLEESDTIVVFGRSKDIARFIAVNQS